ncbi:hypothetical protein CEXT_595761 [Caerostris extrusa]|uniref:Uncharacterized protein n=1 Tax=Caerostris extrusa TaxID=172846 RepID=A0AAV4XZJ9_CAEEX|nr:hypothetical protein CEXT_595761 [Caerostris extrusa]
MHALHEKRTKFSDRRPGGRGANTSSANLSSAMQKENAVWPINNLYNDVNKIFLFALFTAETSITQRIHFADEIETMYHKDENRSFHQERHIKSLECRENALPQPMWKKNKPFLLFTRASNYAP